MVAQNGWVCCGGENGELTIIRDISQTDDSDDGLPSGLRSSLDSRSNLADVSMTQLGREMLSIMERINGSNKTWSASNHKFGLDRVNCITLWQPAKSPLVDTKPGHYPGPVAVLAKNDKTVSVVGLHDCEEIDQLEYPDCVNRALISPDGTLLVAICDDPFLYIHARCPVAKGKASAHHEWVHLPTIQLKGQHSRDTSNSRGSFAACFSPSGRFLAVGTQYGTISIFDVFALHDPNKEALITHFNSSRAPDENGAIRDMAFAPGPFDLLAWTEHRGRIGVADARSKFSKRQIIPIDDHQHFHHFSLNDPGTTDPRLLDPRSERGSADNPPLPPLNSSRARNAEPSDARSERDAADTPPLPAASSMRTETPENLDSYTTPLAQLPGNRLLGNGIFTPLQEEAIIEAVREDRRRRDSREPRLNWRPSASLFSDRASLFGDRASPFQTWARQIQMRDRGESSLTDRVNTQREALTRVFEQRDRLRENREHQRSATQSPPEQERERRAPTPRRRSSVMQAFTQNVDDFAQVMNRAQASGSNEGNTASSRDSPTPWAPPRGSGTGWSDIEALYNVSGGDGHDSSRAEPSRPRRAIPVVSDAWNDDFPGFRRAYGRSASRDHPQNSDDTAGLSWSEDGRSL